MRSVFSLFWNQPYILLTLSALMWGGNAVAGKLAVGEISPYLLTSTRWLVSLCLLAIFIAPHIKRDWHKLRSHLPYLFLMGASGYALFNNLMYLALNHTSAINVSILQASVPLIVFILNFAIFTIRTTPTQLGGYILTLIGVLVIAGKGNLQNLTALDLNFGDMMLLTAGIFYAAYSVMLKKKPDVHWLSFFGVMAISALLASLPFVAFEWANGQMVFKSSTAALAVLYTAIFPSIGAQLFWMRGLELTGANRGGLFINLVPVFGTLLAIIIIGETLYLFHVIALVLVAGGVLIAQKTGSKQKR